MSTESRFYQNARPLYPEGARKSNLRYVEGAYLAEDEVPAEITPDVKAAAAVELAKRKQARQ